MYKIYKVYVSSGFIGTDSTNLVKSSDDEIDSLASDMVWDNYCAYDHLDYDILSVEDIAEEFGISIDSAEIERCDQIYSNFVVEYSEYSVSEHGDAKDYDWIGLESEDLIPYIRDSKIDIIIANDK